MTTADAMAPVVTIGDVHSCASLLREAIWPHLGNGSELILLGDLIDRSPEPDGDRQVIELVRELEANPESYGLARVMVLRGTTSRCLSRHWLRTHRGMPPSCRSGTAAIQGFCRRPVSIGAGWSRCR